MATDRSESAEVARRRERADTAPRAANHDPPDVPPDDLARLVHELRTHQIELEMQNEELRALQEELGKERNFAESVITTAQAIVLVLDPRGRIVRFNKYMEELSGYRLADVRGKDWFDTFLPRHDRERIRALFAQAIGDIQTRGNVNSIVTRDGRERLIEWHDKCLEDAQGSVVGVVAVGQDITERKQTEEALQLARDDLENRVADRTKELAAVNAQLREEIATRRQSEERQRRLEADLAHVGRLTTMGEMASSLAHQLNQPLGAIVLEAEALTLKADSDPPQSAKDLVESLARIAQQAHRAGDLIRRMRQFAKHTTPKRAMLTLAEVVEEVLPLVAKDLREAGIVFTFYADPSLPRILADKLLLQQVFLNLLRNAIEAMESTEFGVRHLDIQTRVHDGLLEVAVRDTGCGIPPDKTEHGDNLFRTFYSTKPAGMGLGLWISRSIIESHGGHIRAGPNPDGGAVFTFTLPIPAEDRKNEAATDRPRH